MWKYIQSLQAKNDFIKQKCDRENSPIPHPHPQKNGGDMYEEIALSVCVKVQDL